jgi:DNA-3-methyladenine glycosylase
MHTQTIAQEWFERPSVTVAPDLIGCHLVRQFPDGRLQSGTIVEVEAYEPGDPACHAYRKKTPRNAVMFGPAGYSYVYLIYGMYHCVNIVTSPIGVPSAVLIRAINVLEDGTDRQLSLKAIQRLAAGPGKLCRYLEIDRSLTQTALLKGQPLWVEHRSPEFQRLLDDRAAELVQTTRIGLTQGVELPWRWYLKGSPAVSRP